MADKPGILFYFSDINPIINTFQDSEFGAIMRAAFSFSEGGTETDFQDRAQKLAFETLKKAIVLDDKRYSEISEKRRAASNKRWEKHKTEMQTDANDANAFFAMQTDANVCKRMQSNANDANINNNINSNININNNISNSINTIGADTPEKQHGDTPTKKEIEKYCSDHGFTFSVDSFIEYYTDRNWNIQDWKAAARGWQKRQRDPHTKSQYRRMQYQTHGKLSEAGKRAVQELLEQEEA